MGTNARVTLLIASCLLGGCVAEGAIFSKTTRPLMTDFDATPVAASGTSSDIKTVTFYVDVEWGEGGIGAIARQHGIAEVYYADIETISVLGYWRQDFVRVYGRPLSAADTAPPPR
jgi:hypothetical protein